MVMSKSVCKRLVAQGAVQATHNGNPITIEVRGIDLTRHEWISVWSLMRAILDQRKREGKP